MTTLKNLTDTSRIHTRMHTCACAHTCFMHTHICMLYMHLQSTQRRAHTHTGWAHLCKVQRCYMLSMWEDASLCLGPVAWNRPMQHEVLEQRAREGPKRLPHVRCLNFQGDVGSNIRINVDHQFYNLVPNG